jgi:hypothetical protein
MGWKVTARKRSTDLCAAWAFTAVGYIKTLTILLGIVALVDEAGDDVAVLDAACSQCGK